MIAGFAIRTVLVILAAGLVFGAEKPQKGKKGAPEPQQPVVTGQIPVAKSPQVKSQAEAQAFQAIIQAATADDRLKAAEEFIAKFADSQLKPTVLMVEAETYGQKNDYANVIVYGERALEADPQNYMTMLLMARTLAQRTREFDLDREEKLGRVEKYAKSAMELAQNAPRPQPNITDDQWIAMRADFVGQAHEALGLAASVRKNYDGAIAEYKIAISGPNPDPTIRVRLGVVYNVAKRYDEAIAALDPVMAAPTCTGQEMPGTTCVLAQVKQFAQAERARAFQAKQKAAAPATPAGGAAPAQPAAPTTAAPAPAAPKP
jgi:tetratricopeptide (TPR) repeat protein